MQAPYDDEREDIQSTSSDLLHADDSDEAVSYLISRRSPSVLSVKGLSSFQVKTLLTLATVRFAETLSYLSIEPYLFFFIASFGIPEADVGYYAGVISAALALAELATSLCWVRLSDRLGRRNVMLTCLLASILPTLLFGLSRNVGEAVLWRATMGLVNGNAPIVATTVAELVPYKPHQALAFSVVPITWSIGAIIGPMLGSMLSDPVKQHPSFFTADTQIKQFLLKARFALPSIACATIFAATALFAFFALPKHLSGEQHRETAYEEVALDDIQLSHRQATDQHVDAALDQDESVQQTGSLVQECRRLTRPIYLNLALSALVCFVTESTGQIFPLLASTSRSLGGLALSAPQVGIIYTAASVIAISGQLCFPFIHGQFGSRGCLYLTSIFCCLSCFVLPNLVHIASWIDGGAAELGTTWTLQQHGIMVMAGGALILLRLSAIVGFPTLVIALTNVVPPTAALPGRSDAYAFGQQRPLLGTVNGLMHAINCAFRGLGPLTMSPFWAWSMRLQHRWVFWIVLASMAVAIAALNHKCQVEEERGSRST